MKNKIKIVLLIAFTFFFTIPIVYANYSFFYSKNLNITVNNINDDIEKIELLWAVNSNPSEVFQYEIAKTYGYYSDSSMNYIWNKEDIKKDSETIVEEEKEVRLYQITELDKNKYIIVSKEDRNSFNPAFEGEDVTGDGRLFTYDDNDFFEDYLDTNKKIFSLLKIKTINEIKNFQINHNSFTLNIKDLDLYISKESNYVNQISVPIFILRFYNSADETKDIIVGTNGVMTTGYKSINYIYKGYDYKTGKETSLRKDKKVLNSTIRLVEQIGIALLLTITIEYMVACILKFNHTNTIIKVNIITQLLFHAVFLIPQTYFNQSVVSWMVNFVSGLIPNLYESYEIEFSFFIIGILEIGIVILEVILYKFFLKEESKKAIWKYAIIANLFSYLVSYAIAFLSAIG